MMLSSNFVNIHRAMQATRMSVMPFSSYFRELDKASRVQFTWDAYQVKQYVRRDNQWRVPLARKKLAKERQRLREENAEPIKEEPEILYVHNADIGVTIPPHPE